MTSSSSIAEDSDTSAMLQLESTEQFPKIGGVYLAPVPEIEEEFYEKLLEEILTAGSQSRST